MDDPEKREGIEPGALSLYQRFWMAGGAKWDPFLLPRCQPASMKNEPRPGVYELGLSLSNDASTIVPVYVGMSSKASERLRCHQDGKSHLADLIRRASMEKFTIWRRVRYVETSLQAERWEARFLISYDYAWNESLNGPKRNIKLVNKACCCLTCGVDVVSKPLRDNGNERVSSMMILSSTVRSLGLELGMLAMVLQILLSITMTCIVAIQLTPTYFDEAGNMMDATQCLLGVNSQGQSLCTYAYIASGKFC